MIPLRTAVVGFVAGIGFAAAILQILDRIGRVAMLFKPITKSAEVRQ